MTSNSKDSSLAYTNDLHLNTRWFRKPWFLAVMVGAAMLLVVVSIFTATSLARDVSRLAQASHTTNEALRVASVVQTEFVTADGFRSLGPDFESAAVIETSADVSAAGLTNLVGVLADPSLSAVIRQELEVYIGVAQLHLADPAGETNLESVSQSFERLSDSLTEERSALIDELESVNSRMNSVATAAGFAIAFFVPATGLYVWEALRRSSGRQHVLERQIMQLQAESQTTTSELMSTVSGLKKQAVKHLNSMALDDREAGLAESQELVKTVDRLDREIAAHTSLQTIVREPIRLVDLVRDSVNMSMVPTLLVPSRSELPPEIVVVIDASGMRGVLTDLIRMVALTSSDLRLAVIVSDTTATVELEHNGTRLEQSVHGPAANSDATTPSIAPPAVDDDADLANLRRQIATAGGSLEFEPGLELSTYSLTMPLAAGEQAGSVRSSRSEQIRQ